MLMFQLFMSTFYVTFVQFMAIIAFLASLIIHFKIFLLTPEILVGLGCTNRILWFKATWVKNHVYTNISIKGVPLIEILTLPITVYSDGYS